jgi:hypothetical protein
MTGMRRRRFASLLVLISAHASAGNALAQHHGGYPTVHNYANAVGIGAYGSFSPYSASYASLGYGYGFSTGVQGPGYVAANRLYTRPAYHGGAQTYNNLQGLAYLVTQVPGWNQTTGRMRPHPRPAPTVPREQLLSGDGTILWPSATPDDGATFGARRRAEEAVGTVAVAAASNGHATIRQVLDAKNKLTDFARRALPIVKAKNAADSDSLERFIVELGKTLQTMAVNY